MILNCISLEGNGPLCLEATKEYQANENRQFALAGKPLPDNRDLLAMIKHFDQLWRIQIRSGMLASAPKSGHQYNSTSLLVDAANTLDDDDKYTNSPGDSFDAIGYDEPNDDETEEVLWVGKGKGKGFKKGKGGRGGRGIGGRGQLSQLPMSMEPVCRNCLGHGHMERECPSTKKSRTAQEAVANLSTLTNTGSSRQAVGGKPVRNDMSGRTTRPFTGMRRMTPNRSRNGAYVAWSSADDEIVDGEGSQDDEDGSGGDESVFYVDCFTDSDASDTDAAVPLTPHRPVVDVHMNNPVITLVLPISSTVTGRRMAYAHDPLHDCERYMLGDIVPFHALTQKDDDVPMSRLVKEMFGCLPYGLPVITPCNYNAVITE